MHLSRELAVKIDAGTKRTIRRPARGQLKVAARQGRTVVQRPFEPRVGQVWSAAWTDHARGGIERQRTVHFRATAVELGPLGCLTPGQARDEGFTSPEAFQRYWVETFDRGWLSMREKVDGERPDADFMETRYLIALQHRPAWTIHIEPDRDVPHLLARIGRGDAHGHGYVSSPAASVLGEPEAIPIDRLHPQWAKVAQARHARAQAARREADAQVRAMLAIEQRLADAERARRASGRSTRAETRLLRRYLEAGRAPEAIERQVAYVEARAHEGA